MAIVRTSRVLRTISLLISVWILYGALPVCTQAEIVYKVVDLGTLGERASAALSINDAGQIVGEADDHATLFDPTGAGNNIDLGTLGGVSSSAWSINNAGQIVGYALNNQGDWRATLFDPTGTVNNLDLGTLGGNDSFAYSINNLGQVVGPAQFVPGQAHATLFDPTGAGRNINLGTPGSEWSEAWSINDAGKIVGRADGRAALFDPTGASNNTDLGTLGGDYSEASCINDSGQIVGSAHKSQGGWHATLFDSTGAGNNIDLGTLGGRDSEAKSINNAGQIVGSAENKQGDWRATMFDPTGTGNNIDLNTLIDPASGWTVVCAYDINTSGWIVGKGASLQGKSHAFLLVPQSSQYGGGTGEPNNPYLIYTAEQMNQIGLNEEDWDKHFMLMADIDLSAYTGASFNLIGSYDSDWNEKSFSGVFQGNGHVISGFSCDGDAFLFFVGLFRSVDGVSARIQNLRLIDPNVIGGGIYVGALVGRLHNGTISNCVIETGRVIASEGEEIGGIVGMNIQGVLSNCRAEGCIVQGRSRVGGLIGTNEGTIQNCYSSGEISGKRMIGGQAGRNFGSILNTYSTCRVTGLGSMQFSTGGLVGLNRGTIQASCATGDVTGIDDVGGLVGQNGDNSNITDSYATGHVSGGKRIGGLVGTSIQNNSIDKCYATGSVSAGENGGGLVGRSDIESVISASFWDVETSGQTTSAGGAGLTTNQMQGINTYLAEGWDFAYETENGTEDIWWILEEQDYPRLWWQYGRACAPYPQDGAIDVTQPLLLDWASGGYDLSHDVYLGEDKEAVANATTESPDTYRGRQAPEITSYDPGNLRLAKTYYWRIDEVNEADPNNTWKGWVWSFTTADFIILDDFESYRDHDNEVWYSWHDGLGYGAPGAEPYYPGNGTGSAVGDETWSRGSHMETLIVHGGRQSMPYSYDNNKPGFLKYSEATLSLDYPRNWTEQDVEVLSLWFYGDLANFPAPMYVAVADANGPTEEVVYHENPYAALISTWTEWTIDLQDFADQGVNLTDVNSISIGFGNRNNPQPGGSGGMFFDDIRLYQLLP